MKKIVLGIAGLALILIGIIGWILPILPGWPFIFLGLLLIAPSFAARLKRKILRKFSKKEIVYLEEWKKLKIHLGFTTRHFSLILQKTDDLLDVSKQNEFVRVISAIKASADRHESPLQKRFKIFSDKFVFINQVHGDHILLLDDSEKFKNSGFYHFLDADGVITNIKDLTLLIFTADCLSVFLSARKGENQWVGLVHAGWRGTQKMIVKKAFEMIQEKSGSDASDIHVIFGPHIGKNYYEVGEEFVNYFEDAGATHASPLLRHKNGKLYFDLAGENKRQLLQTGALKDHIVDLEICTFSENEDFYSFRKEKEAAGRIISFISKF